MMLAKFAGGEEQRSSMREAEDGSGGAARQLMNTCTPSQLALGALRKASLVHADHTSAKRNGRPISSRPERAIEVLVVRI